MRVSATIRPWYARKRFVFALLVLGAHLVVEGASPAEEVAAHSIAVIPSRIQSTSVVSTGVEDIQTPEQYEESPVAAVQPAEDQQSELVKGATEVQPAFSTRTAEVHSKPGKRERAEMKRSNMRLPPGLAKKVLR